MKEKLIATLDNLILISPSNWADIAAEKMNITASAVRMIKTGAIGKKSITRLIELVEVMKEIAEENELRIQKATAL